MSTPFRPDIVQALYAMGTGFSSMLGQVPAIFALAGTKPALRVRQSTTARFWSGKARGNPDMQLGERLSPLRDLDRGRLGSGEGDMLGLLHDLLLSGETSAVGSSTNSVSHLKVKIVKRFSAVLKQAIAQFIKCNCSGFFCVPSLVLSALCFSCLVPMCTSCSTCPHRLRLKWMRAFS